MFQDRSHARHEIWKQINLRDPHWHARYQGAEPVIQYCIADQTAAAINGVLKLPQGPKLFEVRVRNKFGLHCTVETSLRDENGVWLESLHSAVKRQNYYNCTTEVAAVIAEHMLYCLDVVQAVPA